MTGEQLKKNIQRAGLSVSRVAREIGYDPQRLAQHLRIKGNITPEVVDKINELLAPYLANDTQHLQEIVNALRSEVALLQQQNMELHKIIDKLTNISNLNEL